MATGNEVASMLNRSRSPWTTTDPTQSPIYKLMHDMTAHMDDTNMAPAHERRRPSTPVHKYQSSQATPLAIRAPASKSQRPMPDPDQGTRNRLNGDWPTPPSTRKRDVGFTALGLQTACRAAASPSPRPRRWPAILVSCSFCCYLCVCFF